MSEEDLALRKRCVKLCSTLLALPQGGDCSMPQRQLNALCGLPLSLAFALLQAPDEEERQGIRESLKELMEALEKAAVLLSDAGKAPQQRERSEVLAVVPRIACELFVGSTGLVKEATRAAWRELGEFTSDETVTSLCASVCDADGAAMEDEDEAGAEGKHDDEDDESEEDEEDDEEDDGGAAAERKAARIAQFQEATERLKKAREQGEEEEDGDEVMLAGDEILDQLLDDNGDAGAGGDGSLLAAFASSGLNDPEAAGPKLSKRQKRLRQRQEELAQKFQELELVELFVQRFVDKRPVGVQVLQRLFEAMIAAGKRASGGKTATAEGAAEGGASAKIPKADAQIRRVEGDLARRLGDVLAKALKQVCRWAVVQQVCMWHSEEDWASHARALFVAVQGLQTAAVGQRPSEVGAVFLYWLCSIHRARVMGADADPSNEAKAAKGWKLAAELLGETLQDWGGKRDSERWCAAVFGCFANRAPQVLLPLPWIQQIRDCRKSFVQRSQIGLVANQVLRNLPATAPSTLAFTASFSELCAELLENTLSATDKSNPITASQRQKSRRDVLKALSTALRTQVKRTKQGEREIVSLDTALSKRIIEVLRKIVGSLPAKRGEVYQLCLHMQRSLRSGGGKENEDATDVKTGKQKERDGKGKNKRQQANVGAADVEDESVAQEQKGRGAVAGAPEPARKKKKNGAKAGFFGEM